jgi:hypothetical protein
MKTMPWLCLTLGLAAAGALGAATAPAPRTEVIFDHPETFTDIKDGYQPTDKGEEAILRRIRTFLVDRTQALIPEGDRLTITFTEINLAGKFEPWRGINWEDVRIYTSNYPPFFKFTYSVTDASGKVIREGSEAIREAGYLIRSTNDSTDSLRYEKDILLEWARTTLRGLPRA